MVRGRQLAANPDVRRTILDAAIADMKGGDSSVGVRWFIKYCVYCRRVPIRSGLHRLSSAEEVLERGSLVIDFVIWLVMAKPSGVPISVKSAFKYLSQVRAWHRRRFGQEELHGPTTVSQLTDLQRALKRLVPSAERKVRFGVRTQHLAESMRTVLGDGSQSSLMWRALLSLAFCGLLRGAEAGVQEGKAWARSLNLSRADLDFGVGEDGVEFATVTLRVAKRVGAVKDTQVLIGGGGSLVDAVQALKALHSSWLEDGIPESLWKDIPMFELEGEAVSTRHIRGMVKLLMESIGLNPMHFGAHSLRIGGASAAFAAGIEPSAIRIAGRWSSDIYEIYVRLSKQGAARLGATIGSTAFEDLERGEFVSEELELLPHELVHDFPIEADLALELRAEGD